MEAEGARLGHMVEHSLGVFGALLGMAVGALALGALAFFTVATGGLLGVLIVGAAAAGGASLGGTIGKRYGQKAKRPSGPIILPCSIDVLYENMPAAHTTSGVMCSGMPFTPIPHPSMLVAEGSSTVFINGMMAARKGSKTTCSASVGEGSGSIIIGGDTAVHPGLTIKPEFPKWLDNVIFGLGVIGIIGALFLGWAGVLAVLGGFAGGYLFGWIGTTFLGMEAGGDAHFWFTLLGGLVGGIAGAMRGARISRAANSVDEAAGAADEGAGAADDAANTSNARRANQNEEARINEIRQDHQIGRRKNVAYAEGEIDGIPVDSRSHSGRNSKPGTVESRPFEEQQLSTSPTRRDINNGQTAPDRRAYDSEVKILEQILDQTTPTSNGNIKIVTERNLCSSCSNAIRQFRELRPNIEVETVYSIPYNN